MQEWFSNTSSNDKYNMSLSTQFPVPVNREGIHKVWWGRLTLDLDLGQNLFFTRPNSQIKFPNFAIFLDMYFQTLSVSVISSFKNSKWDIYKTFCSKYFLFFLIAHCPLLTKLSKLRLNRMGKLITPQRRYFILLMTMTDN